MKIIIPIDSKTGKPRCGHWQDRLWIPDGYKVPMLLDIPQSNPSFDPTVDSFWNKPKNPKQLANEA